MPFFRYKKEMLHSLCEKSHWIIETIERSPSEKQDPSLMKTKGINLFFFNLKTKR